MKRSDMKRTKGKYGVILPVITVAMLCLVLENSETVKGSDTQEQYIVQKDNKRSVTQNVFFKKKAKKKNSKNDSVKLKKINTQIQKGLETSKGFALGELDENGKPTENGTPNPAFNWSIVVKRIKYTKEKRVNVFVTESFKNLSSKEKSHVALMAQNKAMIHVGEAEKFSDEKYREGLFTFIYLNDGIIGKSQYTDYKDFKWNK